MGPGGSGPQEGRFLMWRRVGTSLDVLLGHLLALREVQVPRNARPHRGGTASSSLPYRETKGPLMTPPMSNIWFRAST